MAGKSDKVDVRFGNISGFDRDILEVHREHLRDHPHVEEYNSAGEYFEQEVGISDVADGYFELPVYSAFRIHSYAPRDYVLLQKNPNLPKDWVRSDVHWSYEDLAEGITASVRMNTSQTAKTVSGYFNDNDTVRLGLKSIVDAVKSELGSEFEGNAFRQSEYQEYLQLAASRAYRDGREGDGADLKDGFHGEFAYTNRCKFQADGSSAQALQADDAWLADELDAIAPKVVFALGGDAYHGLRNVGFEKVGARSQYSDGKPGRVLRYKGDKSNLTGAYAVHLYHLDYRQTLTIDRDVHDALRIISQASDEL